VPPNKSFERTARQLAYHQHCAVSLRLSLWSGQPLNSSVSPHERRCIEDLNAIGESLVELPEPKPKKKKKL